MHRWVVSVRALLFSLALIIVSGCTQKAETVADKIILQSGAEQHGLPETVCEKELVIKVVGPNRRGVLGGRGSRHPVSDVELKLEADEGHLSIDCDSTKTDASGCVRARIILGPCVGDQYLKVSCPQRPDLKPVLVHFVSGIQIQGAGQETLAGDQLPEPIKVRLVDKSCKPLSGVPVHFRLATKGTKAKLSHKQVVTDENGTAAVQLQTDPKRTGGYNVLVEVVAPERGISLRGIEVRALGMNRMGLLIGVLGGLGLFILGMTLMSDGLQQTAGRRLRNVLQFFTRNRASAVLGGLFVTAIIQSSSACTVMVVGFVNAGLLTLHQAIGIVYGAAIGTTVTAQMVSFKLDGLALPAICIGVVIRLVAKRSSIKAVGGTILGFGLLFFGMKMMSHDLKSLSSFPSFIHFFQLFDCQPKTPGGLMPIGAVFGAIAVGTILTMIVQSSSATTGLVIALAISGLVNIYTAIPLILGDNIGTTITAILASIGTNRPARQAAVANTVFKTCGVLLMVACFFIMIDGQPAFLILVNKITAGDVFACPPENIGRHVAAAHTLFNIINVIIFLPFVGVIASLSRLVVRDKMEEKPTALEPHLLDTPSVAIQQSVSALTDMTHDAIGQTEDAMRHFGKTGGKIPTPDEFQKCEDQIDHAQHDIIQYLVDLTRQPLTEEQAKTIPVIMHCVNDVERIGDRAAAIYNLAAELGNIREHFSEDALAEIRDIGNHISKQASYIGQGLRNGDKSNHAHVIKLEGEIKILIKRYESHHEERLSDDKCDVRNGLIFIELMTNLERIAAHFSNIAERAPDIYEHHFAFWSTETAELENQDDEETADDKPEPSPKDS